MKTERVLIFKAGPKPHHKKFIESLGVEVGSIDPVSHTMAVSLELKDIPRVERLGIIQKVVLPHTEDIS